MLVLDYVNVQEDSVRIEGRYLNAKRETIDVLIGKAGLTQGKITYADGLAEWLDVNMCKKMIDLLDPPRYVRSVGQMIENPDWDEKNEPRTWIRMPALFTWIKLTYGLGVHEMTTEYEVTYASA